MRGFSILESVWQKTPIDSCCFSARSANASEEDRPSTMGNVTSGNITKSRVGRTGSALESKSHLSGTDALMSICPRETMGFSFITGVVVRILSKGQEDVEKCSLPLIDNSKNGAKVTKIY